MQTIVADVERLREQGFAAFVGHSNPDRVELQEIGAGPDERLQRRLQRQALRERLRDLVERAEPLRRLFLRVERMLALVIAPGRLLVQAGVLDGDRQLRRERGHERELVLRQRSPARREDGEQPDQVLADS